MSQAELWEELVYQRITVTTAMFDVILRALQKKKGGDGIEHARAMLRHGSAIGIISQDVRGSALISLLNWVLNDELDCADELVGEVTDVDRLNAGVMAAVGAVYCSGTRSPY